MNMTTEQVGTVCVARVSDRLDSSRSDEFEGWSLDVPKAAGMRIVLAISGFTPILPFAPTTFAVLEHLPSAR